MKDMKNVLRAATLSLTVALVAFGGNAIAQTTNLQLVSANAQLDRPLDSSKAAQGQIVTARLTMGVKTADGIKLPKGTELLGKVTSLQQGSKAGETQVGLTFDQARLKNGQTIAVKVTLLGALPPVDDQYDSFSEDASDMASHPVSSEEQIRQEAGVIDNVSLQAAVQSDNSGTFESKKDRITLAPGTQLQVAVAPETAPSSNGAVNGAAE